MRKGGGKQKGAQFERDVCKCLSMWISDGKQEDVYWRSAMSGGRSTVAAAKGKRLQAQAGDISCIHPIGQNFAHIFFIECKFYADLNIMGLLDGTGNLSNFWKTAKHEAQKYGKIPLLVAKQNRMNTVACLTDEGSRRLHLTRRTIVMLPHLDLRICSWSDFLKYAKRPE